MPQLLPALAARAAIVAAATAAVVTAQPASVPAAAAVPARAVVTVTAPVTGVAFAAPAAPAARAVDAALGRLGAPYRWGAAGPNAFDCSGLVKWSFAQAGVALPRTSRAQSRFGTPVARADLRPGDAVFFYRPVSHAAIYIGDGQVVHASTAGQPVKITSLDAMPFTTARRYDSGA